MAANKLRLTCLRFLPKYNLACSTHKASLTPKFSYCTDKGHDDEAPKSRFLEFYEKEMEIQEKVLSETKPEAPSKPEPETFASLLRKSKFVDLGDPEGKEVIGEIYHVVGDDLYIDFGWKFPTVCTAPRYNRKLYVKGAKVRLLIKDLELSTKFLGSVEETTLLEADCVLLGLVRKSRPPLQQHKKLMADQYV